MSVSPLPVRSAPAPARPATARRAAGRIRQPPKTGGLARRRLVINCTKWLLPAAALLLLATIALWPEIERLRDSARVAYQRMGQRGRRRHAHRCPLPRRRRARPSLHPYRRHRAAGRPRTHQPDHAQGRHDPGQRHLADAAVEARRVPAAQPISSTCPRTSSLYRDDGTTLTTASASVDLKNGAAAERRADPCRRSVRHAGRAGLHRHRQGRRHPVHRARPPGPERSLAVMMPSPMLAGSAGRLMADGPTRPGAAVGSCRMGDRSRSPRETGSSGGRSSGR